MTVSAASVAAVVLAAGLSRRMGGVNKLLLPWAGEPLIRRVVGAVLASRARPVVVVTGFEAEKVESTLSGLAVATVRAPDFADGISRSLIAGIRQVPPASRGAMIVLGDMPGLRGADLDRLVSAFEVAAAPAIVVPVFRGQQGNPVVIDRVYFPEILQLSGDQGARPVVRRHADRVIEVEMESAAVLEDMDNPGDRPSDAPPGNESGAGKGWNP